MCRLSLTNPKTFDFTAPQMVLTIKLTSFAYNTFDSAPTSSNLPQRAPSQVSHLSISTLPSLLEFLGFLFFTPSFFIGPAVSFKDYLDYTNRIGQFEQIPSTLLPAFKCFLESIFFLALFSSYGARITFWKCLSDEFQSWNIVRRVAWICAAGFFARCKYFCAWKLSEGACILAGIGYIPPPPYQGSNGQSEPHHHPHHPKRKGTWTRLTQVKPLTLETSSSFKVIVDNWNMQTVYWLRNYVFLRVPGSSTTRTIITYLTSAFWHGFFTGYYLTFLHGAILSITARILRRRLRHIFHPKFPIIYNSLGWLLSHIALNYSVAPFMVLGWNDSLNAWRSLWFGPTIGCCLVLVVDWCLRMIEKNNKRPGIKEVRENPESLKLE